jgi:hypothetical protein
MPEDNKQLHVFANDVTEWVVAYSPEDAVKVWEETVGETYILDEYGGVFEQEPDDKELTIDEEETIKEKAAPVGGVLVESREYSKVYRATMRAWADARGRSFLCSTEY